MIAKTAMAPIRSVPPLLRWAGSKRQLLPDLEAYWRSGAYDRYVEPFAGSAALFFRLAPKVALINDLNHELIETYEVLRKAPKKVFTGVKALRPDAETYYQQRSLRPAELSPLARAIRFVYLNRFCFNGIFRANSAGQFNVPYGGHKAGGVPEFNLFARVATLLGAASLTAMDFGKILSRTKKGEFVYLDPPYCKPSRRPRGEYGPGAFSDKDLARLKKHLISMDKRGVAFVLSYEESEAGRTLFVPGWSKRRVRVRRNVAGFAGQRRRASELVISNIRPVTRHMR
jgi:DNA adenine methylase